MLYIIQKKYLIPFVKCWIRSESKAAYRAQNGHEESVKNYVILSEEHVFVFINQSAINVKHLPHNCELCCCVLLGFMR